MRARTHTNLPGSSSSEAFFCARQSAQTKVPFFKPSKGKSAIQREPKPEESSSKEKEKEPGREWQMGMEVGALSTDEWRTLVGFSTRFNLRRGQAMILNPRLGFSISDAFTPKGEGTLSQKRMLTFMGFVGLRIQQPSKGIFVDIEANKFLAFDFRKNQANNLLAGYGAGTTVGWRWNKWEAGVSTHYLRPFTPGDNNQFMVLLKAGGRYNIGD